MSNPDSDSSRNEPGHKAGDAWLEIFLPFFWKWIDLHVYELGVWGKFWGVFGDFFVWFWLVGWCLVWFGCFFVWSFSYGALETCSLWRNDLCPLSKKILFLSQSQLWFLPCQLLPLSASSSSIPGCSKLLPSTCPSLLGISAVKGQQRLHYPAVMALQVLGSCCWSPPQPVLEKKQCCSSGFPRATTGHVGGWSDAVAQGAGAAESPRPAVCRGTGVTQSDRSVLGNTTSGSCSSSALAECTE